MRRVLIVSPHFPPFNGADMHRVRQSLPYFAELGWEAVVLAAKPEAIEGSTDPHLLATVPPETEVERVPAVPYRWTRRIGFGSLAFRLFPFLARVGDRRLGEAQRRGQPFDLVYFSTTQFPVLALGPYWHRRFGVPFVVDMQDPWRSDHYLKMPSTQRPPKFWLSYRTDCVLESFAMPRAAGLVSVSEAYVETLRTRYPALAERPAAVIPFGGATTDFEVLERIAPANPIFDPHDGHVHVVYVGRGGHDLVLATKTLFRALRHGLERRPDLYGRLRLHFVGTDYAPEGQGQKTLEPLAEAFGVVNQVREYPDRVPYFTALQLLRQAHMLVMPGSNDAAYTASKLYPYILARRPLLAVFHARSSVVDILRQTRAGEVVSFEGSESFEELAHDVFEVWTSLLERLPFEPETDWNAFEPYTAREMTRRQVALFEEVLARARA